jgi:hypothetical protein
MLRDNDGDWLTEDLIHRVSRLGGVLVVKQAPLLDGLTLDSVAAEQYGLPSSEADIGWN